MDSLMLQPSWVWVVVFLGSLLLVKQLFPASKTTTTTNTTTKVVVSSDPPASSTSTKKKKKKSKKNKSAATAAPVVVEPKLDDEPEEEPVAQQQQQQTTNKKKKKKNKKKASSATAPAPKPAPAPVPPATTTKNVDLESTSSDDDDDDVARLLNAKQLSKAQAGKKKKKKKNKKNTSSGSGGGDTTTATTEEEWVMVNKSSSSASPSPSSPNNNNKDDDDEGEQPPVEEQAAKIITITLPFAGEDKPILVGPKGATIQNITSISGARLDIDLPVLKITGTEQAVTLARDMVDSVIMEHKAKSAFSTTLKGIDINMSEGVKAIIGKGGSTIQNIENTTGCKIDASIAKATVTITGPSDNQVQRAATLCRHAVFGEAQDVIELETTTKVMLIMGKDFQKIRQFQDESGGAKLDIAKNSTTLKISGPTAAVQKAKQAVLAWLQHCQGITMPIPSFAGDSMDRVGAIYGKGGATIRTIQDKTGSFIHVDDKANTVQILGVPSAVRQALEMVQQAMGDGCLLQDGEVKVTFALAKKAGPSVIGRGGSNIRQLESKHKCKVRVTNDSCTIFGMPDKVTSARQDIEEIMKPFLEEERIQNEADRLATEGEAASSAWTASLHDTNDADGW